jgi:hypothetical protein
MSHDESGLDVAFWLAEAGDLDTLMGNIHDALDSVALPQGRSASDLDDEEASGILEGVVDQWTAAHAIPRGIGVLALRRALHEDATRIWDEFFADYCSRWGSPGFEAAVQQWLAAEKDAFRHEERLAELRLLGHAQRRIQQYNRLARFINVEVGVLNRVGLAFPGMQKRVRRSKQMLSELGMLASDEGTEALREVASDLLNTGVVPELITRVANPHGLHHPLTAVLLAYRCGEQANPAYMREQAIKAQDWILENTRYAPAPRS